MDVVIYTDGSCSPNPGNGGWGLHCRVTENNPTSSGELYCIIEACDGALNTTNNVMEMTAFYEALQLLGTGRNKIYTDSKYIVNEVGTNIVNGVITGWLVKQRRMGWVGNGGNRILNYNLWKNIVTHIEKKHLTFCLEWVKGHSTNMGNNRADQLANMGRIGLIKK